MKCLVLCTYHFDSIGHGVASDQLIITIANPYPYPEVLGTSTSDTKVSVVLNTIGIDLGSCTQHCVAGAVDTIDATDAVIIGVCHE